MGRLFVDIVSDFDEIGWVPGTCICRRELLVDLIFRILNCFWFIVVIILMLVSLY